MTSYLIDGVILLALIAIGIRLHMAGRELRKLRGYHEHYQFLLEETATAVTAVDSTVRDIQEHGAQILLALGERITDGHRVIGEIDARVDALANQYEAECKTNNVLPFAAGSSGLPRQGDRRFETRHVAERDDTEFEPPQRQQMDARQARSSEKPVKWPTLGERFNQWRDSDETQPRHASTARKSR